MTGSGLAGRLVLLLPMPLFIALAYGVPFLGIASWSVTLPEPGLGQYAKLASFCLSPNA